ncbi:hypothetical protein C1N78_09865 [Serratia marcescens]|nr:hypothetical protein C1N78_09865 [Serratia marcescens]
MIHCGQKVRFIFKEHLMMTEIQRFLGYGAQWGLSYFHGQLSHTLVRAYLLSLIKIKKISLQL